MMLFFGMLCFGFVASITIPGAIAKFDTESRQLEITTYGVLPYFIPNPFPEHEFSIPYDNIRSVEAETDDINVRGAEHVMAHLSIVTDNHTFVIARKQLYHGEFDWITNWDSREEIHEEGLLEAQEVVKILRKEIGLD